MEILKMVKTKSTLNYDQYLKELEAEFSKRYGEEKARIFVKFIRSRYDNFQRVYLDKNIMWIATDDYMKIRTGNIVFYLVVGLGLTGKSTFFKNLAYFFDTTFRINSVVWGFQEMVTKISEIVDNDNCHRSLLTDEPIDVFHPQSRPGKAFKEVIGQLRQQSPILLFCSTDFKDMPTTIVNKLSGLFYLNTLGHGYFIRNDPAENIYPLDDFKKGFNREGYKIFEILFKKYSFLQFTTHKACVLDRLDPEGMKQYLLDKKAKLKGSIKKFTLINERSGGKINLESEEKRQERNDKILDMYNEGKGVMDISRALKLERHLISRVVGNRNIGKE